MEHRTLFALTLLSHLPNAYKFVKKNILITVCFWTLYVGKNGGVEFWQIAVDKANSGEYLGESDDRSLVVVSLHLQALLGKILANCASFIKFAKIFTIQYFPTYVSANTV